MRWLVKSETAHDWFFEARVLIGGQSLAGRQKAAWGPSESSLLFFNKPIEIICKKMSSKTYCFSLYNMHETQIQFIKFFEKLSHKMFV